MPDLPRRADDATPPSGDSALDALLAAGQPPQPAAPALRPVAEVLAALRAGPGGGELAGKARALAEFREVVGRSGRPHRVSARRGRLPRLRLSVKLTAAAAGAALAVGGTAAYAGVLPAPLQEMAHVALAAPAARTSPAPAPHSSPGARAGAAPRQPAGDGAVHPGPRHGNPVDRHSQPGERHGQPGKRHGQPGKRHGHPGSRHGQPGDRGSPPGARHHQPGAAGHPGRNLPARRAGPPAHRTGQPDVHHSGRPTVHHQGKPAAVPTLQRSGIPGSARRR
jgi:hypothetical protein